MQKSIHHTEELLYTACVFENIEEDLANKWEEEEKEEKKKKKLKSCGDTNDGNIF